MVNIQGRILLRADGEKQMDDDLFDGSGDEIENPKAFIKKFMEENRDTSSDSDTERSDISDPKPVPKSKSRKNKKFEL